jgi:hypothetical protein
MTVVATRNASVDADLARREAVIEVGLRTFLEVGRELTVIRAQRLYYQDYSSFEQYCEQRWDFDVRHAQRLMVAAATVEAIEQTRPTGRVPTTERQARELTGLAPEVAAEVMAKVVKDHDAEGRKITAKTIREAREQIAPKPAAETPPELTPSPAVTAYLADDQKAEDLAYVRHFLKELTAAIRVPTWDADRLGKLLDEDEFAVLERHAKSLPIWVERIASSRRGLRLIPGGSK